MTGFHAGEGRAFFDDAFAAGPEMGIFRGAAPVETVARAQSAWRGGAALVEVPVSDPGGWIALEAVVAAADGRPVGVGTVLRSDQAERAAILGASFAVAPGFDPAVSARCAQLGLPLLPGVATASEIAAARALGHRWLKAFPASVLGPEWIAAMLGPFPDVAFVCTGGMTRATWPPFARAGALAYAMGQGFDVAE